MQQGFRNPPRCHKLLKACRWACCITFAARLGDRISDRLERPETKTIQQGKTSVLTRIARTPISHREQSDTHWSVEASKWMLRDVVLHGCVALSINDCKECGPIGSYFCSVLLLHFDKDPANAVSFRSLLLTIPEPRHTSLLESQNPRLPLVFLGFICKKIREIKPGSSRS